MFYYGDGFTILSPTYEHDRPVILDRYPTEMPMTNCGAKTYVFLTYAGRPRTWGLRFSTLDGFVLAASFAAAFFFYDATAGFSLLLLFVVFHFFLFCNVFRIRRKPELIWAGTFIVNCAFWTLTGHVDLIAIAACQLVVTATLILNELRLPCYHGVFARRINPRLDDYIADRLRTQNDG